MPVLKKKPATVAKSAARLAAKSAAPVAKPATATRAAKIEGKLVKLGLRSDIDKVLHLPLRYEDETEIISISAAGLSFGRAVQVEGTVTACEVAFRPRRQLVVTISDDSGQLVMRFLNFYGSQVKQMAEGNRVRARGEVRHGFFGAEMVHPSYKMVMEGAPLPSALTPVYPAGEGLSQTLLRKTIIDAMARMEWHDTLSENLRESLELMAFEPAVKLLHNPPPGIDESALTDRSHAAWIRMKFDELLAQQLSMKRAQIARREKGAAVLPNVGKVSKSFLKQLPFSLTGAQQRVLEEIRADLQQSFPMQRLLQGDVGSGKTVVAALAAAQAMDSGFQAVLMAPTEILADQHFRKIAGWMEPLGVKVAWLTGSLKKKEKLDAKARIESG
jgi:ATP-dependent DNA helicase RecG